MTPQEQIDNLTAQIAALETKVNDYDARIAATETNVTGIQEKQNTDSAKLDQILTAIGAMNDSSASAPDPTEASTPPAPTPTGQQEHSPSAASNAALGITTDDVTNAVSALFDQRLQPLEAQLNELTKGNHEENLTKTPDREDDIEVDAPSQSAAGDAPQKHATYAEVFKADTEVNPHGVEIDAADASSLLRMELRYGQEDAYKAHAPLDQALKLGGNEFQKTLPKVKTLKFG